MQPFARQETKKGSNIRSSRATAAHSAHSVPREIVENLGISAGKGKLDKVAEIVFPSGDHAARVIVSSDARSGGSRHLDPSPQLLWGGGHVDEENELSVGDQVGSSL